MARLTTLFALASIAFFTSGCGLPFEPAVPPGFVDMGEDRYIDNEWRATTADGVVLGVRAFENEAPKGDLGFWSRAVENRLRSMGGYALLETKKVKARDGSDGTEMRFGHDEEKDPHNYRIAIFVTDDWVYIVEAGGSKAEMERMAPQVDWAIQNFLPD